MELQKKKQMEEAARKDQDSRSKADAIRREQEQRRAAVEAKQKPEGKGVWKVVVERLVWPSLTGVVLCNRPPTSSRGNCC